MNWNKWMIELMPIELRRVRIYALIRTLCKPVKELHQTLMAFRKKQICYTSFIPSYPMLSRIIRDEVYSEFPLKYEKEGNGDDGNLLLEDKESKTEEGYLFVKLNEKYTPGEGQKEYGGGKPYDFVVISNDQNIERQRKTQALINRYKMAGKSNYYLNTRITKVYKWSNYIGEIDIVNTITLSIIKKENYYYDLILTSKYPLQSDLKIVFTFYSEEFAPETTILKNKGERLNEYLAYHQNKITGIRSQTISLRKDEFSEYIEKDHDEFFKYVIETI